MNKTKLFTASTSRFAFYNYDHLGNTRVTYTPNCNGGAVVLTTQTALDYYPYGKELRSYNSTAEKYKSTTNERDLETGYDYRYMRLYDHNVVQFKSPDIFETLFPSLNPYNYVVGNPIANMDPMGLDTTRVLKTVLITAERIWEKSQTWRELWASIKLPATDLDTDLAEFRTQVYTAPIDFNWYRTKTILTNVEKGQYVTTKGIIKAIPKKMTKQATEYITAAKGLKVIGNITQSIGAFNMYNDYAGYHNGDISMGRYAVKLGIDIIGFLPPPAPLISLGLSVVEYAVGDIVEDAINNRIEESGSFW